MAARKLQTEIDRTLKKVAEGVELFEGVYEKMQISTNQPQKEKLEVELKQHIKKLQRLRDQIKTWLASNEIKDKTILLENRKLIETQMERFKACEKEMKTKAFSKEGLSAAQKLDPREKEKMETAGWLSGMLEDLQRQIEQTDAELEAMAGGTRKKKGGAGDDRLRTLEELNARRQWHMGRMEIVLRLLENGTLPPDKVVNLKEDIAYFVQSNTEEDFEEDEGIYDDLNLHEEEEKLGLAQEDMQSSHESQSVAEGGDLPPRTPMRENSKKGPDEDSSTSSNNKKEEPSPTAKKQQPTLRRMTLERSEAPKIPPAPNFATQPMSSALKSGLPPAPAPKPTIPPLPPIRYSAAVAASGTPPSLASTAPAPAPALPPVPPASTSPSKPSVDPSETESVSAAPASPSFTQPSLSAPSPVPSSVIPLSQLSRATPPPAESMSYLSSPMSMQAALPASPPQMSRELESPSVGLGESIATGPSPQPIAPPLPAHVNGSQPSEMQSTSGGAPGLSSSAPSAGPSVPQAQAITQQYSGPTTTSDRSSPRPPSVPAQYPIGSKPDESAAQRQAGISRPTSAAPSQVLAQPPRTASAASSSRYPASLSDLVSSFEAAKQKSLHRMANPEQVSRVLENGFATMPQPKDSEKPTYYKPRHPCRTPEYYPQHPLSVLSDPRIFTTADVETLFFAFYYQPGTYQQYLAAKELKKQSWRFHKQYLTWFQRHQEPQAITDEYEQGVYVYFDWENSWCQRKKSDFRFEYRYLSED